MKSALASFAKNYSSALQIAPLSLVILLFLIGPIIVIGIFSFYKYTGFFMVPDFVTENYVEVFASLNTWETYLETLKMVAITLALTFMGAVREAFGAGTVFGFSVFGESFQPFTAMVKPPGAFVVLGLILGLMNLYTIWQEKRSSQGQEA